VVVVGPGGSLSIEGRGTPNGTFVGGFRVRTYVPLKVGDEINVGGGQNQSFNTRHTRFPAWSWRLAVRSASKAAPRAACGGSASSSASRAGTGGSRAETSEPPAKKAKV